MCMSCRYFEINDEIHFSCVFGHFFVSIGIMNVYIYRFANVDIKVRTVQTVTQQARSKLSYCWSNADHACPAYFTVKITRDQCLLNIINYTMKLNIKNRAAKIFVVLIHWVICPTT